MKTNKKAVNELHSSELYLYFYEDFIKDERTAHECEFISEVCKLKKGDKILDLACGHGRHSKYFGEKGFEVCGIDMNSDFIRIAKENSQLKNITYTQDDILNLDFTDNFNTIFLLYNSLGFFSKSDAKDLISKISKALKIGGKLFLDVKNRDHILKEISPCSVTEKGKDLMIDRIKFNPIEGTTTNDRIYIKDGKRYDAPFTMQMYNYSELANILSQSNLQMRTTYGNWSKGTFNSSSKRIILVLEKIAEEKI